MGMKGRKRLDLALLALFFAGLLGLFLPRWLHVTLGLLFLGLMLVHNLVNAPYYASLARNCRTASQRVNFLNILLLWGSVLCLAMSGAALAGWLSAGAGINWRSWHLGASVAALVLLFFHLLRHGRRYLQGRHFTLLTGVGFVLAAASFFVLPYFDRWYRPVVVHPDQLIAGEKALLPGRVITVYFSRVGNTQFPKDVDAVSGASLMRDENGELIGNAQMIAAMVQNAAGGDQAAILTTVKYPAGYGDTVQQARKEISLEKPPFWRVFPRVNLESYDTVILIYPLWWDTLPPAVESFLTANPLAGKRLIPVVTHGGGGAGDSLEAIRAHTRARVAEKPLTIYSSDIPAARQQIADYLKQIRDRI